MQYTKIILCGKRCTGKTTLFWDLQKRLEWPTFTISQYLRDYIHRFHLTSEEVEARSAEVSRDIDDRVASLIKGPDRVVIDARVYEGEYRNLPNVASILLTARDDVRLSRAAFREKTTPEKQGKRLFKRENAWLERIRAIYGDRDFFEPSSYTLTIDTSDLTPEQVLERTLTFLDTQKSPPIVTGSLG